MTQPTDYVFTSESVSEGHPDKVCDQVSDSIVDLFFEADPYSRVAVETLASTNRIILAGEVRGPESVTADKIEERVRRTVKEIGYELDTFHWNNLEIHNFINQQSPDIAQGVDAGSKESEGAGDQGIMFGYACRETDTLMPAAIHYSHRILKSMADVRHSGEQPMLGPDAKSQISLKYVDGKPVGADSVVVSTQHDESLSQEDVRAIVQPIVEDVLPNGWMCPEDRLHVNPTGRFVIGGPAADAGLTGRKIIVDTYGGAAPHGGGAFSGKDPTKVDRSAAYICRYMAKNVVAAGLADKCTIQLSYAIGITQPISLYLDMQGTGNVSPKKVADYLMATLDLSPRGIREQLELARPIYRPSASYGHFGRQPRENGAFSWERTDLVDALRAEFNIANAA